jgi:uncharacterized protein
MKNSKLEICDVTIHPGEIANLALPLPQQYSCAPLYMPIKVIHGKKKGACLLIFSGLKGTELNGLEIANRISKMIKSDEISGTLIIIPVVNVYGLTHYPFSLPSGSNLSNCFPGDENGTYGERIAHLFTNEILKKADYCIELQTGEVNHNILPQIYCNFDHEPSKKLSKFFQTPVITSATLKANKLRLTTEELQIPFLAYEAGEAMRFDENAITLGIAGIKNIMGHLGMLDHIPINEISPIFSRDEEWIRSHKAGILHYNVELGQTIKKNDLIATIDDPLGDDVLEPVKSPQEGIVVGINTSPLIHEGLPIFKIASFLDYEKAENIIKEWNQKQTENDVN